VFTEQLTDLALYFGVFGERLETGINRYSMTEKILRGSVASVRDSLLVFRQLPLAPSHQL